MRKAQELQERIDTLEAKVRGLEARHNCHGYFNYNWQLVHICQPCMRPHYQPYSQPYYQPPFAWNTYAQAGLAANGMASGTAVKFVNAGNVNTTYTAQ